MSQPFSTATARRIEGAEANARNLTADIQHLIEALRTGDKATAEDRLASIKLWANGAVLWAELALDHLND